MADRDEQEIGAALTLKTAERQSWQVPEDQHHSIPGLVSCNAVTSCQYLHEDEQRRNLAKPASEC